MIVYTRCHKAVSIDYDKTMYPQGISIFAFFLGVSQAPTSSLGRSPQERCAK